MKTILSLFILVFVVSKTTFGQSGPAEVTKTSIGIYNTAEQDIKILLGENKSALDTFTLARKTAWYSRSYNKSPIFIRIQTKKSIVKHSLVLGNYHLIYWNENKKYWDIKIAKIGETTTK